MGLYRGVVEVDILVAAANKKEAEALMNENIVAEAKNVLTERRFAITEICSAKEIPSDWIGCLIYHKDDAEILSEDMFPEDQDPRQLRMF